MARSPAPGFGWKDGSNTNFENSRTRVPAPGLCPCPSKSQALKSGWQGLQALVHNLAQFNFWKFDGKAESQAVKIPRQGPPLQALVEYSTKTQALKIRWQGHLLQALVECPVKLKLWRSDGKVTCSRLCLKRWPKLKIWRLDAKLARSRL